MKTFNYHTAKDSKEAKKLSSSNSAFLAGGMTTIPSMKLGLATYKDRFKVGTSYRHNEAVILFFGYSLLKQNRLHLGYAFDYVVKNINAKSTTSNEIHIRYDLPMPQVKKPIRTPRYIY